MTNDRIDSNRRFIEGKVLLIDDEAVVREIGSEMLESLGLECITATDGQEGVKLYKQFEPSINLVILDVEMPGISGDKVFDLLKEINPGVKILVISGYTKTHLESNFFQRNLKNFMPKPFQLKQLTAKLTVMIGRKTDEQDIL